MAEKSKEIVNLALRKVNIDNKAALLRAQEAIKNAMASEFVIETLMPLDNNASATTTTRTPGEFLPKLTANLWRAGIDPLAPQYSLGVDFASRHDDTAIDWGMMNSCLGVSCLSVCQPARKTVHSRIVEPLALPGE